MARSVDPRLGPPGVSRLAVGLPGARDRIGNGSVVEPGAIRAPTNLQSIPRVSGLVDTPWFAVLTAQPMGVA